MIGWSKKWKLKAIYNWLRFSCTVEKFIRDNFDLTPKGIICKFFPCDIKPIFYNTARNGHFGYNDNDTYYPWERVDFSDKLKEYVDEKELSIIEF